MSKSKFLSRIPITHLLFLIVVLSSTGFLLWDSWRASASLQNLVVIAPAAIIVFALAGLIVFTELRSKPKEEKPEAGPRQSLGELKTILSTMALFGLYTIALTTIGFDAATFIFIAAGLRIQGEKRPLVILVYAAVFTLIVVLAFGRLLPYPMKTLVL